MAECLITPASSSLASGPAPLAEGLCPGLERSCGWPKGSLQLPRDGATTPAARPPFAAASVPHPLSRLAPALGHPPPRARPRPFPSPGRGAGPRLRVISLARSLPPLPPHARAVAPERSRCHGAAARPPCPGLAPRGLQRLPPAAQVTGVRGGGQEERAPGRVQSTGHLRPEEKGRSRRRLWGVYMCVCVGGGADSKTGTVPPEVCVGGCS